MLANDDDDNVTRHVNALKMAYFDVTYALKNSNLIPKELQTIEGISDITNVVLSGVSIQGNKKAVEIGLKIFNEFRNADLNMMAK